MPLKFKTTSGLRMQLAVSLAQSVANDCGINHVLTVDLLTKCGNWIKDDWGFECTRRQDPIELLSGITPFAMIEAFNAVGILPPEVKRIAQLRKKPACKPSLTATA